MQRGGSFLSGVQECPFVFQSKHGHSGISSLPSDFLKLFHISFNHLGLTTYQNPMQHREISSVLCDHLGGEIGRVGGRETQEGRDMGTYVYV